MKNPTAPREPSDIPRQRHEGWGDDNATPTPEESAHRHEAVESLTGSTAPQADRRYAIREETTSAPNEVVDNEVEGDNMETGEPTDRPAGDKRPLGESIDE